MMTSDINKRLNQLRTRRDGSPSLTLDSASYNFYKSEQTRQAEPWEKRGQANQPYTKYAIGAMQAVSDTYTKVSLETADRVVNQLRDRLPKGGISADFRLQGSVPLDVHIKGVSDVDLLVLDTDFLTYMKTGPVAQRGGYRNPTPKTSVSVLSRLRSQIESDLEAAFYAAKVDKSGAKAIKITGGSLARDVDVVPAHWLDTIEYQATGNERDRGVTILNKTTSTTIDNHPFLHIDRIRVRCESVGGGLRKAIRLCKNVKEDSEQKIALPSFDIAAVIYHADLDALRMGKYYELAVLAETQRYLDVLARDFSLARTLFVPDGSRRIFDTEDKLKALVALSIEIDELLACVYREHAPSALASGRPMSEKRKAISALAA
jgi:hypothetical protein